MKRRLTQSTSAFEWLEQATHLLRTAPPSVLAAYFIGAIPFVLGLLFFWADMSRSPFAKEHVVEAAFGLALLFVWMKAWQSIFCVKLRALVSGEPVEPVGLRRGLRIAVAQATIQPAGLLLIPLAMIFTLPFAWVFGFYQNATVFAEPGAVAGQSVFRRAARATRFWPGQYHVILLVLSAFAGVVLLNWSVVCVMLPGLLKTLAGVETVFSRSPFAMLNSTFFATMGGLTYLCVDPVVKALHVLRCFRGEAQSTGDDLKAELRHVVSAAQRFAALLAAALLLGNGGLAHAAEPTFPPDATPVSQPSSLPPQQLDRTIEEVINQQKYTWRMPREKVAQPQQSESGVLARFFTQLGEKIRDWARRIGDWLDNLGSKRSSTSPAPAVKKSGDGIGPGLAAGSKMLLIALLALAVAAVLYLAYRLWRNRRRGDEIVEAAPLQVTPDLTDENISAEQLPEDEWTRLGRELLAKGEFRLAIRAFYLSSLAYLGQRQLITLAKFKSNRDYERELARRGHALGEVLGVFGENVVTFDRVWYGRHDVDAGAVSRFAANVQKIRTTA